MQWHLVSLVNIVPEPAGHNCSAGGQAIQTGLDTNDDGILEAGEVEAPTSYVCNPGCQPGYHDDGTGICVLSGCASGYHDGGNGTCVASGTCVSGYHNDGTGNCAVNATLATVVPEPAGPNCDNGGVAIQTGVDTNGDGILEKLGRCKVSHMSAQ